MPRLIVPVGALAVAIMQAHVAAPAQPADPRAADVGGAFVSLCAEPRAAPDLASERLDGHPEAARKLDSISLATFFGPAAEKLSIGWITRTPNNAWYVLAFAPPIRSCSVLVKEIDAPSLIDQLRVTVRDYVAKLGGKVTDASEKRISVEGVPATESVWRIDGADGSKASIIASVADQPFGAKQALITYSLLHIGKDKPAP